MRSSDRHGKLARIYVSLALLLGAVCYLVAPETAIGSTFRAQGPVSPDSIVLVQGTVPTPVGVDDAVKQALAAGPVTPAQSFAVTDVQAVDSDLFVSVVGLSGLSGGNWNIDDNGVWFGLVLLVPGANAKWDGAVEGTADFSRYITAIPDTSLAPAAKRNLNNLDRTVAPAVPSGGYLFPWQPGTQMYYGDFGIHDNGFGTGFKAVDFLSDGNVSAGHSPNSLRASAGGSVSYKCTPPAGQFTAAIRIGDLMYTHLLNSSSLYIGRTFVVSEEIGKLQTGSFNESCGYATQDPGWFHVHWGFPNTGSFDAGGWTLSFADQAWRRGAEVRGTGNWFLAEVANPSTTLTFRILLRDPVDDGRILNNPLHGQRPLSVQVYNLAQQSVFQGQNTVQYNQATDEFTGSIDLGTGWSTGVYIVKAQLDYTLREQVAVQTITNGVINAVGPARLRLGDVTQDNKITIDDYNVIMDCYSDLAPARNCADPNKKRAADINDDGSVNGSDYNLWLRVMSVQVGS
jgi:hypothetical protein